VASTGNKRGSTVCFQAGCKPLEMLRQDDEGASAQEIKQKMIKAFGARIQQVRS
jgi:hypothetical protein